MNLNVRGDAAVRIWATEKEISSSLCLTVLAFIPGLMGPAALSQIELLVTEALYL